ncbi:hypothetical protein MPRS_56410 [Mycobacterium paraseoulense]|nr:hypothetical protein MPRS_56410 [Mycobacterium paraseoulense]
MTDARMTFKMVRCRSVSDESTACSRPPAPADEVSLLSLMALNVAPPRPRIKHVFDWRVAVADGHKIAIDIVNHKGVTLRRIGYFSRMSALGTTDLSVAWSSVRLVRHASLTCSDFEHTSDTVEQLSESS